MLIKFAIKDIVADKKYKNLSIKTIGGYVSVLDMFQNYLTGGPITALNLFKIISPYMVPSMMYKMDMEYRDDEQKYNRYQYD